MRQVASFRRVCCLKPGAGLWLGNTLPLHIHTHTHLRQRAESSEWSLVDQASQQHQEGLGRAGSGPLKVFLLPNCGQETG